MTLSKQDMVNIDNQRIKMEKAIENKIRMQTIRQNGYNTKGSKTQRTFSNKPKNMNRRTGR